jgi:hypothetical protein
MLLALFLREIVGVGSNFSTMMCLSNTPEFLIELGIVDVNSRDGYRVWQGLVVAVFLRLSLVACLIYSFSSEPLSPRNGV